ncbi:MAG: gamma-glutamyl-gamma-aminobutyrate hydrolase family protein [bacterium]|nr:gamma-glutamyl-gamma-aminobutyrate hydrolase family protein [bacterium]
MKKPLIGVTLDQETTECYSKFPWYALRVHYTDCLSQKGALPVALPYGERSDVELYSEHLDGLVITGGDFDIDPKLYGDSKIHPRVSFKPERTQFEMDLFSAFFEKQKPILGICGGIQVINVAFGGTLYQHLPDEHPSDILHEQPNPRDEPSHDISIEKGTQLYEIARTNRAQVNSAHHQAIKDIGKGLRKNAVAPDGVLEGFEHENHPFCLGVQWHPEYLVGPVDHAIIQAFVQACHTS